MVTNAAHIPAIEMESRVAAGIGRGASSQYERLFIGCTNVDAPPDLDVVHVNITPEDMRFPANGPRILIDGKTLPFPNNLFRHTEGSHIPFDWNLTPTLMKELFRTLKIAGTLSYAPSSNVYDVFNLMNNEGFTGVRLSGFAPRTHYRGRATLPAILIVATHP